MAEAAGCWNGKSDCSRTLDSEGGGNCSQVAELFGPERWECGEVDSSGWNKEGASRSGGKTSRQTPSAFDSGLQKDWRSLVEEHKSYGLKRNRLGRL